MSRALLWAGTAPHRRPPPQQRLGSAARNCRTAWPGLGDDGIVAVQDWFNGTRGPRPASVLPIARLLDGAFRVEAIAFRADSKHPQGSTKDSTTFLPHPFFLCFCLLACNSRSRAVVLFVYLVSQENTGPVGGSVMTTQRDGLSSQ